MDYEPLTAINDAYLNKLIPMEIYEIILKRLSVLLDGIKRIEKTSMIKFPPYYIEPSLVVSSSLIEFDQYGLLFARTIPDINNKGDLSIFIQITAPLVVYGLKSSIQTILAHEFLHYVSLVNRFMKMNIHSDNVKSTFYEEKYDDFERLFDAKKLFKNDNILLTCLKNKFQDGFKDVHLEEQVVKNWINRGLRIKKIRLEDNNISIPVSSILNFQVEPSLKNRLRYILEDNCNKF